MRRHVTLILIWGLYSTFCLSGCATMRQGSYIGPGDERHARYAAQIHAALDPIVASSQAPDDEYRIRIYKSPNVNAWSLGRRRLVFTTTLLDLFTHTELTGVCAHEVAHELLRHNDKKKILSLGISSVFQVANIFVPGAVFADLIANPLITRGYSRAQEVAADGMAIELMQKIGYSIDDYVRLLERVSECAGEKKQGGLLDDHPSIQERIAYIKEKTDG